MTFVDFQGQGQGHFSSRHLKGNLSLHNTGTGLDLERGVRSPPPMGLERVVPLPENEF